MLISVIIATWNRSQDLRRCLESFSALRCPPEVDWELIVVDNNSSDDTRDVVASAGPGLAPRIRYLWEPRQGKAFALNTGLRQARGDLIAFTDDDCILDGNWLVCVSRQFQADLELGLLGGRVELYDARDCAVTVLRHPQQFILTDALEVFSSAMGCNMVVRRHVVEKVGGFDISLGPGTPSRTVAEDLDYIYRVHKAGFRIAYAPDVLVLHNHGRRSNAQLKALGETYGRGRGAFYCKHVLSGDKMAAKMAYWELRSHLLWILRPPFQAEPIRHRLRVMACLARGAFAEMLFVLRRMSPRLSLRCFQ